MLYEPETEVEYTEFSHMELFDAVHEIKRLEDEEAENMLEIYLKRDISTRSLLKLYKHLLFLFGNVKANFEITRFLKKLKVSLSNLIL